MGVHPLIKYDLFPEQSKLVGTEIQFEYGGEIITGIAVRDDINFPQLNRRIIKFDKDKYLLIQTTNSLKVLNSFRKDRFPNELDHPLFQSGCYPKQGGWFGKRTEVCFHYDTTYTIMGTIVRSDGESPWEDIIRLDDGRYVLTEECQHSPE